MTREQVKAIFPDATDEHIDAFLNANGADINKAKKSAADNNAEFERLKAIEKEYEKLKGSTLTEQEKLQKQLEAAEKAEKLFKRQTNKVSAEKLFVAAGLKDDEYSELLEYIVTEDTDQTTKTAMSFVGILKAQKAATEKAVKEQLMRDNPRPPSGDLPAPKGERAKLIDQYNEAEKRGDFVLCQTLQARIQALPKE